MVSLPKPYLTPEQYLELEREAAYKSEYLAGEMVAMAGASEQHNLITGNVFGVLWQQFRGRSCRAFASDMRVKVSETGLYTYPDVVALCGELRLEDARRDTLLNPMVIVEVLSRSTEAYDRGDKFAQYRRLETLTDYILVAQDKVRVEHFVRQANGNWLMSEKSNLEDTVHLASVNCDLLLAEIYDKVEFETGEVAEAPP